MYKTKQQKAILILALMGILHLQRIDRPSKKRVLTFIRIKKLYRMPEWENEEVSSNEKAWENRFAWLRSDLHNEGIIAFRERDCWEITQKGKEVFKEWLANVQQVTLRQPDWKNELVSITDPTSDLFYTPEAFTLALEIGKAMNH